MTFRSRKKKGLARLARSHSLVTKVCLATSLICFLSTRTNSRANADCVALRSGETRAPRDTARRACVLSIFSPRKAHSHPPASLKLRSIHQTAPVETKGRIARVESLPNRPGASKKINRLSSGENNSWNFS